MPVVIDKNTGLRIPMIYDFARPRCDLDYHWIVGINKTILKGMGIKVFKCERLTMIMWRYLVLASEIEAYLNTYNLPHLIFRLGA